MALIIDTASASQLLGDIAFRQWAAGHSVFVSSEMQNLGPERDAVASALRALGVRVEIFEDLGGRDDNAETAYLAGVASTDIYLGIVGDRYGRMLTSGRSPTHEEYLEARARGKRISVWVNRADAERQGNARDFVDEVQAFHTTGGYTDAGDLVDRVVRRVREIAADDEAPWVKIGEAVLRATSIVDSGETVTVTATVRDECIARFLEGLRGDQWGRAGEVTITTSDRSGTASVEEVRSETRSRSLREITLRARVTWADGRGGSMDAGTQGYSADDLTELGLRAGLLGEGLPDQLGMMEFMVDASDPLGELPTSALPEGSVEPIARLLIVEHLIGGGKAGSLESFEIGPAHKGARRVRLTYTEPRRYTNEEPGMREVDGSRASG